MDSSELITKAETYLVQCGSCDAGLPMACVCPPGDPRAVISELIARLRAARAVCAERERELLELKGPCSDKTCRLHYAHSGPCDTTSEQGS